MRSGEIGFEADGFAQGGGGFRKFALLFKHGAQRVVGLGVIRLDADGVLEFASSFVEFSLLP